MCCKSVFRSFVSSTVDRFWTLCLDLFEFKRRNWCKKARFLKNLVFLTGDHYCLRPGAPRSDHNWMYIRSGILNQFLKSFWIKRCRNWNGFFDASWEVDLYTNQVAEISGLGLLGRRVATHNPGFEFWILDSGSWFLRSGSEGPGP